MSTATVNANNLELNKGDQIFFAVDVSASMGTKDCEGNTQTRIDNLKEKAKVFATEAAKYDEDGADYFTFGSKISYHYNQRLDSAITLIDGLKADQMSTNTAGVLDAMYSRAKQLRKDGCTDNIVAMIITDGAPADKEAVKTSIRKIADDLQSKTEFNIIFLTIGEIDDSLRSFLTDLDDNLKAKFDIVDVKAFKDVDFEQAFGGALTD